MNTFLTTPAQHDSPLGSALEPPMPHVSGEVFVSGFGALVERESELQEETIQCMTGLGTAEGFNIDRILRSHHKQLSEVIHLLRERFYLLPHSNRFTALHPGMHTSLAQNASGSAFGTHRLELLAEEHMRMFAALEELVRRDEDSTEGAKLLKQAAQRHEEMSWMLMALVKEDESMSLPLPEHAVDTPAVPRPPTSVESWENEGGATAHASAPASAATMPVLSTP